MTYAYRTADLDAQGQRYELSVKRRVNYEGETVEYLAADSLQSYVTELYRAAGFGRGFSSHSGRRTFASRLIARGHSIETVQLLLGHVHFNYMAPYIEISKKAKREAMIDLGGFFADA
ncbi:tyrosine-type recombinase/integrase [Burkholderia vietnamiensis]|uniref:Tyrosine-type recombinase/integrase n=1 Tax=Burkholderia vietnamiensis TaxID=60552 RepID=A0AAW7T8D5_BURVI|nr:tyrosine-type recombinase/integrase [Burkholderia vietnamiensis]MDN7551208.1 tyrosine-type recombinase/integrase [Burkholderia vietnamiensis]MDN7798515.1 tyrosine-type recombinase/integrase [Burkholderia vietnamiensis]MDN8044666.1 tyrosine-type recombinase/integrase [Burkholderia vietnamiensis]MDN8076774.1 tyrosine-type recombinase/integrase [Burkholderia vietnamiensis]